MLAATGRCKYHFHTLECAIRSTSASCHGGKVWSSWRTITERLRTFYSSQGEKLELRPKKREESEDVSCRVAHSVVPQIVEWLSCSDSTFLEWMSPETEFNPLFSISGKF